MWEEKVERTYQFVFERFGTAHLASDGPRLVR